MRWFLVGLDLTREKRLLAYVVLPDAADAEECDEACRQILDRMIKQETEPFWRELSPEEMVRDSWLRPSR